MNDTQAQKILNLFIDSLMLSLSKNMNNVATYYEREKNDEDEVLFSLVRSSLSCRTCKRGSKILMKIRKVHDIRTILVIKTSQNFYLQVVHHINLR
jgi:hypothetical protein